MAPDDEEDDRPLAFEPPEDEDEDDVILTPVR